MLAEYGYTANHMVSLQWYPNISPLTARTREALRICGNKCQLLLSPLISTIILSIQGSAQVYQGAAGGMA